MMKVPGETTHVCSESLVPNNRAGESFTQALTQSTAWLANSSTTTWPEPASHARRFVDGVASQVCGADKPSIVTEMCLLNIGHRAEPPARQRAGIYSARRFKQEVSGGAHSPTNDKEIWI